MTVSLTRREVLIAALGAVALAVLMHWPLPVRLGDAVPRDAADPLPQAWQVAWGGHALLHQPLDYFQANIFWPQRNTLAFSDALVGYSPAGLIGSGIHATLVRYDLLLLFAYALCFFGAYLLARELGLGRLGGAIAGAAFAYAPWRLEQDAHLHILSSGGIPLALALLIGGYRRGRPGLVVAGWAVTCWQISLGWSLGLQLGYLLVVLGLIAAWRWQRAGRRALDPRLVRATLAGGALLLLTLALLGPAYIEVLQDHPDAQRRVGQLAGYSPQPWAFLAAPPASTIWGRVTGPVRDHVGWVPEMTLFPGLAIAVLAVLGARSQALARGLRRGLVIGIAVLVVLALGLHVGHGALDWAFPYRWVFEIVPGWKSIRVPTRLMTLITLGVALLGAAGAERAVAIARARGARPRVLAALPVVLVAIVLLEGAGFGIGSGGVRGAPLAAVPPVIPNLGTVPDPLLILPVGPDDQRHAMLASTDGFPRMVNGRSSYQPPSSGQIARAAIGFPDAPSVARLRALGVRSVVLDAARLPGTLWAGAASKPVTGLGLGRQVRGAVVVYTLDPGARTARPMLRTRAARAAARTSPARSFRSRSGSTSPT